MAIEPEGNEAQEQAETATNKRIMMIVGAALALLLVVVAVVFYVFVSGREDAGQGSGAGSGVVDESNIDEAFYVAMPRDFIFNVPGARRDRIAQIGVQLLVRGSRNEVLAQENIPLLEATLLDVFSQATAERLTSSEGKRELRFLALDAIRLAMQDATDGSFVVERVLFTGFVLQ